MLKNVFFNKEIFNQGEPFNMLQEMQQKLITDFLKKKEDFIISKIIDCGFGYLLNNIENKLFPRIACIRNEQDGFDYIYADNNTDKGYFIVAIRDKNPFSDIDYSKLIEEPYKITLEFEYQDTVPLDYSKYKFGLKEIKFNREEINERS